MFILAMLVTAAIAFAIARILTWSCNVVLQPLLVVTLFACSAFASAVMGQPFGLWNTVAFVVGLLLALVGDDGRSGARVRAKMKGRP